MDKETAQANARAMLVEVLTNQPNLIQGALSHNHLSGTNVATFCSDFIESYSKYLVSRQQSER